MQLANYLGLILAAEEKLAQAFERVGKQHAIEIDVLQTCKLFRSWSLDHVENLKLLVSKYGKENDDQAKDLYDALFETRMGALGLLRDLQGLWLMVGEAEICYTIILQGAKALRDKELELSCTQFRDHTKRQKAWLLTKIEQASSQTLVVAES